MRIIGIPWVPWDSHGNGNRNVGGNGMGKKNNVMGTGLAFSLYILFSVLCM